MNTNQIITTLSKKQNGSYFKISWVSDIPLTAAAKRMGIVAFKHTTATVRKGIRYANLKSVRDREALMTSDTPITHELPWGQWVEGHNGLLIEHKGKTYLRLYNSPNKAKVIYFFNGKEVTRDFLEKSGFVQKSYFAKPCAKADAITVNTANIEKIY